MPEFTLGRGMNAVTAFQQEEGRIWLGQLFGLTCGFGGRDDGPTQARGLALVDSSLGLCESEELKLEHSELASNRAQLVWSGCDGKLRLESTWALDPDNEVLSRQDRLQNTGSAPVTISRFLARFPFSPGTYEFYSQGSHWSNENRGLWQELPHGSLVLGCEGGRTTQGGTPFLSLREKDSERGVAFHLLPRGNWRIRVRRHPAGGGCVPFAVVELGLSDEYLKLTLGPGEWLDLPEILMQGLPQGEEHLAAPQLHRYVVHNLMTRAKKVVPVVYNTWFDAFDDVHLPRLRKQLAAAREIGCEVFTIDAGWYGQGMGHWAAQTGDWREKLGAAFNGHMADFAAEVRAAGLGFGLWVEPERIGPQAPIRCEHPEWFIPGTGGFCYPNLTDQRVYAYILDELSRLAASYQLAWMKVDFNFSLDIDPSGAEFSAYYTAWYRLLEEFRARFPGMFLEGCASGGMRLDLATLSHFDGHFLSDSVNPVDAIRFYEGALLRLPPGRLGKWAVMRPIGKSVPVYGIPLRQAPVSLVAPGGGGWDMSVIHSADFICRVTLPGMLTFSGDLAGLPPEALERLRFHVAFFKEWRQFIAGSYAHLLTPPRPKEERGGWSALQLGNSQSHSHLLFVYRLDDGVDRRRFYPRELVPERRYCVIDIDHAEGKPTSRTGAELMAEGLEVTLPTHHSAAVLVLQDEDEVQGA